MHHDARRFGSLVDVMIVKPYCPESVVLIS